jgi:hypothetical protein
MKPKTIAYYTLITSLSLTSASCSPPATSETSSQPETPSLPIYAVNCADTLLKVYQVCEQNGDSVNDGIVLGDSDKRQIQSLENVETEVDEDDDFEVKPQKKTKQQIEV